MAKRRRKNDPEPEPEQQVGADMPAESEAVEYPTCACGARLVLEDEQAAGVCESCGFLGADGRLYRTPEEAENAQPAEKPMTADSWRQLNDLVGEQDQRRKRWQALSDERELLAQSFTKKATARRNEITTEMHTLDIEMDKAWAAIEIFLSPFVFAFDLQDIRDQVWDGRWEPFPVVDESAAAAAETRPAETPQNTPESQQVDDLPPGPAESSTEPTPYKLPFPAEPFDFRAAFEDLACKARLIEAGWKKHDELHKQAAEMKKRIEADETEYWAAMRKYDEMKRDAEAEAQRQEKLQAAHLAKLEEEAAKAAQPELPIDQAAGDAPAAPIDAPQAPADAPEPATVEAPLGGQVGSQVGSATPLQDALPACACGNTLALDVESASGVCTECNPQQ